MAKLSEQDTTFTQSAEVLETVLTRFKSESLPLEEALTLFETGVSHLNNCQKKLTAAKGTVEELVKTMEAGGEALTKPFE